MRTYHILVRCSAKQRSCAAPNQSDPLPHRMTFIAIPIHRVSLRNSYLPDSQLIPLQHLCHVSSFSNGSGGRHVGQITNLFVFSWAIVSPSAIHLITIQTIRAPVFHGRQFGRKLFAKQLRDCRESSSNPRQVKYVQENSRSLNICTLHKPTAPEPGEDDDDDDGGELRCNTDF